MSVGMNPGNAGSEAEQAAAGHAHDGRCVCGKPVPLTGPGVTYDHRIPIWFGSPDVDEGVRPLCDDCDPDKTGADQSDIAKTKRLIAGPNAMVRLAAGNGLALSSEPPGVVT